MDRPVWNFMLFQIVIVFVVCWGIGVAGAAETPGRSAVLQFEAEAGRLSGEMQAVRQDDACGGRYITTPGTVPNFYWNAAAPSLPESRAEISVDIPASGTYYAHVRITAPDSGSDALYIGFTREDMRRVYPSGQTYGSQWQVLSSAESLKFDNVPAGSQTLILAHAEPGVRIDKVVLTSEPTVDGAVFEPDSGSDDSGDIPADEAGILAVPGAQGFGRFVRGAYAGSPEPRILIVDDLRGGSFHEAGTNRGTFRWAMTQKGPRIVVFAVSGYIDLTSGDPTDVNAQLRVENPYVSVYGQTAPGQGVTITGHTLELRTKQVILQHLRFRARMDTDKQIDALTIFSGSDVFVDHCSFSYAQDENVSVGGPTGSFTGPLTISNCILSHPLHGHQSKGMLMGGTMDHISVIRNAFIHCGERQPLFKEDTFQSIEIVNNMNYNPYWWPASFNYGNAPKINFIGNAFVAGPDTTGPATKTALIARDNIHQDTKLYLADNRCPNKAGDDEWTCLRNMSAVPTGNLRTDTPFDYPTPAYPSSDLEANLTATAGAFYWNRDSVDELAIENMLNRTGHQIQTLAEAIYPEIEEESITLPNFENAHADDDANGYTNLEEWVYGLANPR